MQYRLRGFFLRYLPNGSDDSLKRATFRFRAKRNDNKLRVPTLKKKKKAFWTNRSLVRTRVTVKKIFWMKKSDS